MADFLEAYADRFAFPVMNGTLVERVRQAEDGQFEVLAGKQRIAADQVIVATGAFRNPRVPAVAFSLDPAIRQLHSSEYRNPSQLRDGPVLVVGLSHSGADIAFEVSRTHRTYMSGKAVGEFPIKTVDTRRALLGWFIMRFLATGSSRWALRSDAGWHPTSGTVAHRCYVSGAPTSVTPA